MLEATTIIILQKISHWDVGEEFIFFAIIYHQDVSATWILSPIYSMILHLFYHLNVFVVFIGKIIMKDNTSQCGKQLRSLVCDIFI